LKPKKLLKAVRFNTDERMKILVIRFSSIGDIVLTTPVVRCLKTQLKAEIHYLTKPQFAGLLEHNPYIDRVIPLPNPEGLLRYKLRKEKYDAIIDLHHNVRSRRFSMGLSPKVFRFNKLNVQKWLMVNLKINKLPKLHIVDRYMDTVVKLGVTPDNKGLDYFHGLNTTDVRNKFRLPETYSVFAIGGQHTTKKMPLHKMVELLDQIKVPLVLLGGKEDLELGELISQKFPSIVSLCGATTLHESAAILSASQWVISHDSGMMHIAAAYGKTIISIWGNTIPDFGMYPFHAHPDSCMFEVKDLACRPCSKIGHVTCPKGHFNCMEKQDTAAMAALINR
jgi:heptosyltransferase-2